MITETTLSGEDIMIMLSMSHNSVVGGNKLGQEFQEFHIYIIKYTCCISSVVRFPIFLVFVCVF